MDENDVPVPGGHLKSSLSAEDFPINEGPSQLDGSNTPRREVASAIKANAKKEKKRKEQAPAEDDGKVQYKKKRLASGRNTASDRKWGRQSATQDQEGSDDGDTEVEMFVEDGPRTSQPPQTHVYIGRLKKNTLTPVYARFFPESTSANAYQTDAKFIADFGLHLAPVPYDTPEEVHFPTSYIVGRDLLKVVIVTTEIEYNFLRLRTLQNQELCYERMNMLRNHFIQHHPNAVDETICPQHTLLAWKRLPSTEEGSSASISQDLLQDSRQDPVPVVHRDGPSLTVHYKQEDLSNRNTPVGSERADDMNSDFAVDDPEEDNSNPYFTRYFSLEDHNKLIAQLTFSHLRDPNIPEVKAESPVSKEEEGHLARFLRAHHRKYKTYYQPQFPQSPCEQRLHLLNPRYVYQWCKNVEMYFPDGIELLIKHHWLDVAQYIFNKLNKEVEEMGRYRIVFLKNNQFMELCFRSKFFRTGGTQDGMVVTHKQFLEFAKSFFSPIRRPILIPDDHKRECLDITGPDPNFN